MQFHLNGYTPGDPAITKRVLEPDQVHLTDTLPDQVDVLIVGCGPAGLTLAAQLAVFPEISTRIIDLKPGPLLVGQADGIACRTMEMFEAFGFSERVLREAYWVNETCFWRPDEVHRDMIVRSGKIQDTEDGLSEFPHVILNQARVHDFLLDVMRNAPANLEPDYGRTLLDLQIAAPGPDGETARHPVTVKLERLGPSETRSIETVRARYVIGCDGARSAVRKALGSALHGDSANQAWGVMDILAVTDFPDIRLKAAIHSGTNGSLLIIPREGGYLVRLYIELDKLGANERVADRNITIDRLIAAAQRILHPYTLDVKEVAWWSVYEIGQRLCDKFDDVTAADMAERLPAVFIAGDACHTHSPKAGQGMNVSMQDGFNLGWKLASVLCGRSSPSILHTYSAERQTIAKELIDFDREFARMFSAAPKRAGDPDGEGVDPEDFQRYFAKQGRFTAGTATEYKSSLISAEPKHQPLARDFIVGMRFHSAPVIRFADAKPVQLGHVLKADGRWRLFLFADAETPSSRSSKLSALCAYLAGSSHAPIQKYTPAGSDIDSVFDVRAVLQQKHRDVSAEGMPDLLMPRKGKFGLIDYEKMFCSDPKAGDIFDLRGVERTNGCIIIVRPDQYISNILPLDAYAEICSYFDAFMLPVRGKSSALDPSKDGRPLETLNS